MTIYFSAFVALVGMLMFGFSANPKVGEIGRIMFACGLLAFLFFGERLFAIVGK